MGSLLVEPNSLELKIPSPISTALTAFILWNFGSGPIRGFAITLLLGILSSMFTAVFVTRVIFHYMMKLDFFKKLSF